MVSMLRISFLSLSAFFGAEGVALRGTVDFPVQLVGTGGNAAVTLVIGGEPAGGLVIGGQPTGGSPVAPLNIHDTQDEGDYPEGGDRAVAAAEEMQDVMEEVVEIMRSRASTTDELKEDLAALHWYEDKLHAEMDALNENEYCRQVYKESVLVGEETSAPEMAEMLADMRCEMFQYSVPTYTRLLEKKLDEVHAEQQVLLHKIEARRAANRTQAVQDMESAPPPTAAPAARKATSAATDKESSNGVSWWQVCAIVFLIAFLVGGFFAGKRLRQWRSE